VRALGAWLLRVAGGEGGPCSPTEATLPGMGGDQMRCSAACQTSKSRRAYQLAAAAAGRR
jgi:hypothetical protein